MTKNRSDLGVDLQLHISTRGHVRASPPRGCSLFIFQEELQVDLENSLQKPHIGALVQTDLVLPDIDNQNLACRQGKQSALAFKVLIFTTLASIGALHVHNEDILGQLDSATRCGIFLVLGHPYSFGGLASFTLAHDTKLGAKEVVQQGGFAGGLGTEDGDEMVVEAGLGNMCLDKVVVEDGAISVVSLCDAFMASDERKRKDQGGGLLVLFLLVDDLDAVFILLGGGRIAHSREMAVHGVMSR